MEKKRKFSDAIRKAVADSGLSRYRIAKQLGVSQALLSRFMTGKGWLGQPTMDALAELLGLTVTVMKKPTTGSENKKE
jgi:transcriptional regulator with XRE-family HTH domain